MKDAGESRPAVGLNAHLLNLGAGYRSAGISSYIRNLLGQFDEMGGGLSYHVFLNERRFRADSLNLHYTRLPAARPPVRILWEQLAQPLALRRAGVSLHHAMAFVAPVAISIPFVVTVYDLSFLRYPDAFRPFNRLYLRLFTSLSAGRARKVIAISRSTASDVVELLRVDESRVEVVYCGVDGAFRPLPVPDVEEFRQKKGLPGRFVLFVGTIEPRKNVEGLLRAYALWRGADGGAPPLVVAGAKGWYYERAFSLVEELGLRGAVVFPGYISAQELPLWYNAAELFVYPSLFEGFGLPVLEAMACGTPVVTSDLSSLPEVGGDAALLVPPLDHEALARAMRRCVDEPGLRESMRERGMNHAARFTWRRTAEQTAGVYREVLGLGR